MVCLEMVEPASNPNSSWRNKVTDLAGRVRGGSIQAVEDGQIQWSKDVSIVGLIYIGESAD